MTLDVQNFTTPGTDTYTVPSDVSGDVTIDMWPAGGYSVAYGGNGSYGGSGAPCVTITAVLPAGTVIDLTIASGAAADTTIVQDDATAGSVISASIQSPNPSSPYSRSDPTALPPTITGSGVVSSAVHYGGSPGPSIGDGGGSAASPTTSGNDASGPSGATATADGGAGGDGTTAADTPGTNGHNPGGGPGGCGPASGVLQAFGGDGRIRFTCERSGGGSDVSGMKMSMGANCCCCLCPATKEETGLPDSITLAFDIGSSSDTGMPSDIPGGVGPCPDQSCADGTDWYYRFTQSDALVELLKGPLTFDFVEKSADGCCYTYRVTPTYTPPCGDGEYVLFGDSPFTAKACSDSVTLETNSGTGIVSGPDPDDGCCHGVTDCSICGYVLFWGGGFAATPEPIYGTIDLVICFCGNSVNINISYGIVVPCKTYLDCANCAYSSNPCTKIYHPGFPDHCELDCADNFTGSGATEGCNSQTGSMDIGDSRDLTSVAGATIWDKIKATTFSSNFELSICSCAGGGCVGSYNHEDHGCDIQAENCACFPDDPVTSTETDGAPVDVDCLYTVGSLTFTLS